VIKADPDALDYVENIEEALTSKDNTDVSDEDSKVILNFIDG
jgi:hypothetical protein